MTKYPFKKEGVLALQNELYVLPQSALRVQVNSILKKRQRKFLKKLSQTTVVYIDYVS